jgi:hypothetical protein
MELQAVEQVVQQLQPAVLQQFLILVRLLLEQVQLLVMQVLVEVHLQQVPQEFHQVVAVV